MDVRVQSEDGDVVRLAASGQITADDPSSAAKPIHDLLEKREYKCKTLLDLQETEFISTSGIAWLVVLHKRHRTGGGVLVIHSIPVMIMEVLQVMRLDRVFAIAEDEAAALAKAQGAVA